MTPKNSFELSTTVDTTAMQVLFAFLDVDAIKTWAQARNAVVQPRPGGLFVVEWEPGAFGQDDLLGPTGGTLAGVLDKSMGGHFVYFGALHWLTPKGEVFGPTRLEIDVFSKNDPRRKPTLVRVRGTAFQSGPRWERYHDLAMKQWETCLAKLKTYCESQAAQAADMPDMGGAYLQEAVLHNRRIS
jgi:hypothetical protein